MYSVVIPISSNKVANKRMIHLMGGVQRRLCYFFQPTLKMEEIRNWTFFGVYIMPMLISLFFEVGY